MIDNPEGSLADVTLAVGDKTFGGLRVMLSLGSDVFKQMLYGEFAESQPNRCIPLPSFEHAPSAVRELLLYLHTGKASMGKDLLHLYEAADYFQVAELKNACAHKVARLEVKTSNAIELLNFADRHGLNAGDHSKFIKTNADAILTEAMANGKFALIPRSFLRELFEKDNSNISESVLFQILLNFSDAPHLQAELVPYIRLPLIPAKFIMKDVLPSGHFSERECLDAVAFQADSTSVALPAEKTKKRKRTEEGAKATTLFKASPKASVEIVQRRRLSTLRVADFR